MPDAPPAVLTSLAELTADIVVAYVANNAVPAEILPDLIASVYSALGDFGKPVVAPVSEAPSKRTPAQIRKSITDDALVSFEDGKRYKTLKRHLTGRGLSPEAYKLKWGLPADYPMTAPSYSAARSGLAKAIGLGNKGRGKTKGAKTKSISAR